MKKKSLNSKRLTLKKIEISKLNGIDKIYGGQLRNELFPGGGSAAREGCITDSCNGDLCPTSIHDQIK